MIGLAVGIPLLLVGIPLYFLYAFLVAAFTFLINLPKIVRITLRRLHQLVTGTAAVRKRLQGEILTAKETVLQIGLELYVMGQSDGSEEPHDARVTAGDLKEFEEILDYTAFSPKGFVAPGEFVPVGWTSLRRWLRSDPSTESDESRYERPIMTPWALLRSAISSRDSSEENSGENGWDTPTTTIWAISAMKLLNVAEAKIRKGDLESGYRAYLQAERRIVEGEYRHYLQKNRSGDSTDMEDPLRSNAVLVLEAIEGYDTSESDTVRELLCGGTESSLYPARVLKESLSFVDLDKALMVLNEIRLKDYRRLEFLRVNILGFVGLPALLLVFLVAFFPQFLGDTLEPLAVEVGFVEVNVGGGYVLEPGHLIFGLVLMFGAIGAAFSALLKIGEGSKSLGMLMEILGYWLVLVRMLIGSISAFIVSISLLSGVVSETYLSLPLVVGVSIAAGFSERLALDVISSFEAKAMSHLTRDGGGRTA
jgi:hypothetical protein